MMNSLMKLPFLVILMGLSGIAMLLPMGHAFRIQDYETGRIFLQSAVLIVLLTTLIGVASVNYRPKSTAQSHLVALFGAFVILPVFLAFPVSLLVPWISFSAHYFEMLSALTTTGATVFDDPSRISEPIHLWRAFVGWLGGFLMLVSAIAIMAPLNLGGFEIYGSDNKPEQVLGAARIRAADVSERLVKFARRIGPIYLGVTLLLALGLLVAGERSFVAIVRAMSTVSTSGIHSGDKLVTGFAGELLIFVFLFLAVSRLMFNFDGNLPSLKSIRDDHEFRLALALVAVLPILLFLRHWLGAFEVNDQENAPAAFQALWGAVFTTLSFLTTTGFESESWAAAQDWSGLPTSGIILLGLAVMGGGVATTAGGIKLLRVYALYKHGVREMQKLSFPSSIGGAGRSARFIRREGAYVAWMFFMLFAISTALTMLALSMTGLNFETSLVFAVSALSTTGPLASAVLENGTTYAQLDDWARGILGVAMVLGRLETLAIIALLNPDFWRR
ncbi:MAG: trk system potassium uptake protein TrkH [Paracoccaceae bacterium]|jgi:trk system potassium uptake protein TrkH